MMTLSEFSARGGSAGRGKKRPSSAANAAKARASITPERRAEILAKARAAKALKRQSALENF